MDKTEHTVVIASKNPVKIEGALRGFHKMFSGQAFSDLPVSVPSNVPDQPMSDEETLTGAVNRVKHAFEKHTEAAYWVGIEGSVEMHD